jgi:hypothetical protein
MSGGSFDYAFVRVVEFADSLSERLKEENFDEITTQKILAFLPYLKLVSNIMHDIEWYCSCDIGVESLNRSLDKFLEELK